MGEYLFKWINLFANTQFHRQQFTIRFQREITGSRGWRMISSPVSFNHWRFPWMEYLPRIFWCILLTYSSPGEILYNLISTYLENYDDSGNEQQIINVYRTPTSFCSKLNRRTRMVGLLSLRYSS